MTKNIALFLAAIICTSVLWSQSSWQPVSSPVDENLVSVCFVDMQHGWILSDQGTFLTTVDGGLSWQTSALGEGTYTSVYFTDQFNGCVTGYQDSSFIMNTGNNGYNWYLPDHEKAERLNDACSPDYVHAWTVGIKDNLNYILYSENAGDTWVQQAGPFVQGAELFSVSFRDELSGSACGAAGAFYTTNNGGDSWALDINIPSLGVDMNDVYNWGLMTGCAVGEDGTALVTTNKWGTYVETTTNTEQTLNAVSADESTNKMWAAGENGTIIFTSNYILGWIVQNTGTTEHLRDIFMIDDENGWAVGDNGSILKFGPNTAVEEFQVSGSRFQVDAFPNPTRGSSRFAVRLPDGQAGSSRSGHLTIKIYDLHGREVMQVLDAELPAGEHEIQVDMSGLPPGVYFVELRAQGLGQRAVSKLMVQ